MALVADDKTVARFRPSLKLLAALGAGHPPGAFRPARYPARLARGATA